MSYENVYREPTAGDLVTVRHALGMWLVDRVTRVSRWEILLGLKGRPGSYIHENAIRCHWHRSSSAADRSLFMSAAERIQAFEIPS